MDPLTALGVVSNVISLIEFSGKLIKLSKEAHSVIHGSSEHADDVDELTKGLVSALSRINYQQNQPQTPAQDSILLPENEADLQRIANGCTEIARKLLEKVASFRAQDTDSRGKRAVLKLQYVFSKGDIADLEKRLEKYQKQMDTHVLLSIRHSVLNQLAASTNLIRRFNDQERLIVQSIQDGDRKVAELVSSVTKFGDTFINTNANEHEVTRRHISTALSRGTGQSRNERLEQLHDSLKYQAWNHRQAEIALAHRGTSEWIFANPGPFPGNDGSPTGTSEGSTWPSMVHWLEGKDGHTTYWISGKPAAGKSTLMKFLFMHTKTRAVLDVWAAASKSFDKCFLVSHFFWANGSDMQQNIVGMLRSILFQILNLRPDLRASVLTPMLSGPQESPGFLVEWSRGILLTALQDLLTNHEELALCLFVDGLDECCDDHDDLVDILQTFIQIADGRVRLLVSSRPWSIFVDVFGRSNETAVLCLHDHTASDVQKYIIDKLSENSQFRRLSKESPEISGELIEYLTTKAQGTFAWVKLAVHAIRKVLRRGKVDLELLLSEAQDLPGCKDLDSMFDQTLERIDSAVRQDCATLLLLFEYVYRRKPHKFRHELYATDTLVFELSFALLTGKRSTQDGHVYTQTLDPSVDADAYSEWLEGLTGGLLEATYSSHYGRKIKEPTMLHLTASRWLVSDNTERTLRTWFAKSNQDLVSTILECCGHVLPEPSRGPSHRDDTIKRFIQMIDVLLDLDDIDVEHIELMAAKARAAYSRAGIPWPGWAQIWFKRSRFDEKPQFHARRVTNAMGDQVNMAEAAMTWDVFPVLLWSKDFMSSWSQKILRIWPIVPKNQLSITTACQALIIISYGGDLLSVQTLLQAGADPNYLVPGIGATPWQLWLIYLHEHDFRSEHDRLILAMHVTKTFLDHGASKVSLTKLPGVLTGMSNTTARASEYLDPFKLHDLSARGLYDGPIDSELEWRSRMNQENWRLPLWRILYSGNN